MEGPKILASSSLSSSSLPQGTKRNVTDTHTDPPSAWYQYIDVTNSPCETKITNFQNTIGVDQQVSWFDVPVDDFWSVKVLDSSEYLVEEHLDVVRGELLGGHDDLVQVALHQLGDEVDFLEKVDVRGLEKKWF